MQLTCSHAVFAAHLRRLQGDLDVAALDGQVEPRPLVLHEVQRHLRV